MHIWIRRPQEREGKYQFNGKFHVTQGVLASLSPDEIIAIYLDIQMLVRETGGLDYFQVYINDAGDKLYFIDECDPEMLAGESFKKEFNHCTLLFDHEY